METTNVGKPQELDFNKIDKKWQKYWEEHKINEVKEEPSKPSFYILDMFPYPSGAGLHVGHPLGYIATDIYSRFMKMQGYNVLHPMGFDAFGLPAEQYAIERKIHPKISTYRNIERYKEQLKKIGLDYDWDREIITCDPKYYKWTQWIFLKFFNSWYNVEKDKAEPIESLISHLEKYGTDGLSLPPSSETITAKEFNTMTSKEKSDFLMKFRLIYQGEGYVNWCPQLGTVLANEEVKEGLSERGGFPVYRKKLRQWFLRTTAFAHRLLKDLDKIDWPQPLKQMQRNWIGPSSGAYIYFPIKNSTKKIKVFTTRPDTIYGVTFIAVSPENEWILEIIPESNRTVVEDFIQKELNKSELERLKEKEEMYGVFSGLYAINPINLKIVPIWVASYVIGEYGTGVVMGVPGCDQRDWLFAKKFNLEIITLLENTNIDEGANTSLSDVHVNSGILNGLIPKDAINKIISYLEENGIGERALTYKMRDAVISRQRYWGEPIPIYYKDGIPYPVDEKDLPIILPDVSEIVYKGSIKGPLAEMPNWTYKGYPLETYTMPGWAGSSWYYIRYMDPNNDKEFVSREKLDYWGPVDIYVGGAEHATGHLIYVRTWTKFLYDLGYLPFDEPAKKLINQGLILGMSALVPFVYTEDKEVIISENCLEKYKNYQNKIILKHIPVQYVNERNEVDLEKFFEWYSPSKQIEIIKDENGKFLCKRLVEKMSKSKYNVINPDEVIEKYGADTFRLYEMFMGPIEESKPWDSSQIEGVARFLKRIVRIFDNTISDEPLTEEEKKLLNKTIQEVYQKTASFNFNTAISAMMIFVNHLYNSKSFKKKLLEDFLKLLAPYAPHIAEELWERMGNKPSIFHQKYPVPMKEYLAEEFFKCPITINAKVRALIELPVNAPEDEIKEKALSHPEIAKRIQGKKIKRVIVIPRKIVNIVVED